MTQRIKDTPGREKISWQVWLRIGDFDTLFPADLPALSEAEARVVARHLLNSGACTAVEVRRVTAVTVWRGEQEEKP